MRLGFYTNYTPDVAEFACRVGFRSMELSAWPTSNLNADQITDKRIAEIKQDLETKDIEISALGFYPNFLDPDKAAAEEAQRYFLKVLDLAVRMKVPVVCTFAGRHMDKSVQDNIPMFKEVFSRFCDEAEKRNIRIAIENCPMLDRFRLRGENIAFSPEIWDEMFRVVPSRMLGIEMDPSHMVWQGMDYIKAIYDYGDRIFHVHAKDMEVDRRVLARVGILGQCFGETIGLGHGWWRARTPGWGEVDWPKFITALLEVDYKSNVDIEHEDDVFGMSTAMGHAVTESGIVDAYGREEKGLVLGYNTLSRLMPPA